MSRFVFVALAVVAASAERGGSPVYTSRIDDPKAQYLAGLSPRGNDTAALQADIDKVEETTGEGILFIPEGRYRISQTVCVAGYPPDRPASRSMSDANPGTFAYHGGESLGPGRRGQRVHLGGRNLRLQPARL